MRDFKVKARRLAKRLKSKSKKDEYLFDAIKQLGFKKLRRNDNCFAMVYSNGKLIIKTDFCECDERPKYYSCPTFDFTCKEGYLWRIQPLCERRNSTKAFEILDKKLGLDWIDGAPRNCGWYKGKPVIFDW